MYFDREFSVYLNESNSANPTWYMDAYGVVVDINNRTKLQNTTYSYPTSLYIFLFIEKYVIPCIVSIGIFFNVFASLILRKTEFKKVAPFVYILSLCIIDVVYLTAKIIPNYFYNIYIVPGVCQIVNYLLFVSIFMEWWIIVLLMSERCVALYSSRISSKYCNAFRIKCTVIVMSLLSIVAHLYHTWTSVVLEGNIGTICTVIPELSHYLELLRKLDVIFAFIIPLGLIVIMLVILTIQLCRKKKRHNQKDLRQFVTTTTTVAKRPVTLCVLDRGRVRRTLGGLNLRMLLSKRQITMKLMLIVILKIALCAPHDILKAKLTLFNVNNGSTNEHIVLPFLSELYILNFSIKGILCLFLFPYFRRTTYHYFKNKLRSCCQRICTSDHDI